MSDVLRWVADQYRQRLFAISRDSCYEVDKIMVRAGQGWICDESVVDPDELVTSLDVGERHGISAGSLRLLVMRYGIPYRGKRGKYKLYRLGDILSARAAKKTCQNT